jgi:kynurenine formamidase
VDGPHLRGVDWLERGDGIGLDDIAAAEERCGFTIEPGDVLLLRTGQYRRWLEEGPWDPNTDGSSGPKPEILPLLRERGVAVLGSDTGNDVMPTGYDRFTNPVHQIGIVALGLWIFDNADLEGLAVACRERSRWEFLINILPLRLTNATGSPATPVAAF